MANPVASGSFDNWITNTIPFNVLAPKTGDTGTFDVWITGSLPFSIYQEAVAAGATLAQSAFRFRNDDGSESTASWKAAQNTGASLIAGNSGRLRIQVDAAGDPGAKVFQLEYRKLLSTGPDVWSAWIRVPLESE